MIRAFFILLSIANLALPTLSRAHGQTAPIELQGAAPADIAIPRTVDGHPDFGGRWSTAFITPVARMAGAKAVVVSDDEARQLARGFAEWAHSRAADVVIDPEYFISGADELLRVNGEWRSSQITSPADGIQHYTAEGKRLETQKRDWSGAFADGPEMRPPFERCLVSAGSAPWTTAPGAEFVLKRTSERVLEYACHEHNYSMVNILQAGRVADAKAKSKSKRR